MFKKAGASLKRNVTAMLDLPKEVMLNLPLVTLIGCEELNIENYKGVLEYTEEKVRIKTTVGIMSVEGKKLSLKLVTQENISVTGSISKMEYSAY